MEGSRDGLAVPCRPAKPPAELPSHLPPTDPAPPVSPQIPSGNLGMFGSSGAAQARTMQQPPQPPVQPLSSSQPSLRAQVPPFLSPQVGPVAVRADAGAPMAGGIGAMGTSLVMRASSPTPSTVISARPQGASAGRPLGAAPCPPLIGSRSLGERLRLPRCRGAVFAQVLE